jgi:hypothetical protein
MQAIEAQIAADNLAFVIDAIGNRVEASGTSNDEKLPPV